MNDKKCPNCNAILSLKDGLYECDYCSSKFNEEELNNNLKNILNIDDSFDYNAYDIPTNIIPFNKSIDDFIYIINSNTFGKFFIPKVFKKIKKENVKKVYVPFYLFDIRGEGDTILKCTDINAKAKEDDKHIYVKKYKTTINSKCDFIKLPICANSEFDMDILNGIEPFNKDNSISFNKDTFSNELLIEKDIDVKKSLCLVSSKVKYIINDLVMKKSEHKISVIDSNNTKFDLINCYLVYYPIYYYEIDYNNSKYYYSMNGDDGKNDFDIPISNSKMIIFTISFMIFIFVIVFLLLLNL